MTIEQLQTWPSLYKKPQYPDGAQVHMKYLALGGYGINIGNMTKGEKIKEREVLKELHRYMNTPL